MSGNVTIEEILEALPEGDLRATLLGPSHEELMVNTPILQPIEVKDPETYSEYPNIAIAEALDNQAGGSWPVADLLHGRNGEVTLVGPRGVATISKWEKP